MSLLSLVLSLRPLNPVATPNAMGRAAHALLLDAVRRSDPALAESLHAGSETRPFTASDVIGYSRRTGLSPDRTYALRFTALTAPVARALLKAGDEGGAVKDEGGEMREAGRGALSAGAVLNLDGHLLRVEASDIGAAPNPQSAIQNPQSAIHNPQSAIPNPQSPWAAATDYETLSAPWLLGRVKPEPRLTLLFASPTTFKSREMHVPAPLPGLVFGSLLEKWNAFAPVALPAEVKRYAEECLALGAYRLRTRMVQVKEGGLRAGAIGQARYVTLNYDRYWMSLIQLLADFALFSGVGAGATIGLGQCRRIDEPEAGEGSPTPPAKALFPSQG